MAKKKSRPQKKSSPAVSEKTWEWAGIAVLAGAVLWMLKTSWRKWPDPLIDFGRELYLPWRISEGAILYRDMDANYGPLSHYFNALIFRISGPGLMHLVMVNLVIYAAILALLYYEIRVGWGRIAAFASTLFFVIAFSFSQFVGIGNYNFAAPYSHETTHGFFLLLVLIGLCVSWLRQPNAGKALAAGFCCGLTLLLKIEIAFAAGLIMLGAIVRAWLTRPDLRRFPPWLLTASLFVAGGLIAPLLGTAVLWKTGGFSFPEAFTWANSGWLGLFIYKDIGGGTLQAELMGTDHLAANLQNLLLYGGVSIAAICGAALLCKRFAQGKLLVGLGMALIAAAFFASAKFPWLEIAKTFPAWLCLAACASLRWPSGQPAQAAAANMRWLILLAAGALLARMALNPRIYHYGYFQAPLAGIVTVATIFSLPVILNLPKEGRIAYIAALAVFFLVGAWNLEAISRQMFSLKVQPIGEGADRFYGFHPQVRADGILLEETRKALAKQSDCKSLFVVPEGITLNYLLRKPSTIPVYMFNPYWLKGREKIVAGLERNPPDYAVLISRDLREFGVQRFGESPEHGQTLISWLDWNYKPFLQLGGDPLDVTQSGAIILKKTP